MDSERGYVLGMQAQCFVYDLVQRLYLGVSCCMSRVLALPALTQRDVWGASRPKVVSPWPQGDPRGCDVSYVTLLSLRTRGHVNNWSIHSHAGASGSTSSGPSCTLSTEF